MEPLTEVIAQGGLRPMQVLRDHLRAQGVDAEVVCPPGPSHKG